ncbi:hypothetical protein A9995_04785 [Erythrobacter sp. QSSC1-22B]|nr:hypothetical protein A9995_04785 [Erythrobacter sp. QSSC1-22B]
MLGIGQPASAQDSRPPQRIDLLVTQAVEEEEDGGAVPCVEDDYATVISGEIVVCGQSGENTDGVWNQEAWERRYAAETMNRNNPAPVDPCGPNCGIFTGKPTIGGLCIPGLQKCPPPPAIMIDFAALPEAPPGSDADRIARGLAPLGSGGDAGRGPISPVSEEKLGLPPLPDFDEEVSPAESAEPGAER